MSAPKGHGPPDPTVFSLQTGRFQGTAGGGHDRVLGPPCDPRCHLVGEGHAPVVAVLLAGTQSQTSPLRPPKGTDPGPCELFPLQNRHFQGPPEGAMIAIVDPMQPDAVMVGEGHAPVVAGSPALRRSYNKRLQGKA